MCGIFGVIGTNHQSQADFKKLAAYARQRGRDASGLILQNGDSYLVKKENVDVLRLLRTADFGTAKLKIGHSRLITNGLEDNQPVVRDGFCLVHNGIVVNETDVWKRIDVERKFTVDSEAILGVAIHELAKGLEITALAEKIMTTCVGTMSCALVLPRIGKLLLFSNNGSLFFGHKFDSTYFASEKYPLEQLGCRDIQQVKRTSLLIDIDKGDIEETVHNSKRAENLIPKFNVVSGEEKLLKMPDLELTRCTRCILPHTMPFIKFDAQGVCNYCHNYKSRNKPKPKDELFDLVESYRKPYGSDCIVPFSGGRDSCYALHLIVNELKMKPVTYTYDWGMVTDLGRRNISRMCDALGVENIIVAADINKKRRNIALNLKAWLKSPNLGMVSILTAGDKHFFKHVETVKRQTRIELNLWGVNPLEVTHFKSGFLGIPPDFEGERVYTNGALKQARYQLRRLNAMLASPGYFNSSIWDTLSGEYHRSFTKKTSYFHIFDYWQWNETLIDNTLAEYAWELAPDTSTTWRIGDGTAAFYNYIYRTVAGFTEHDTFRSNQIREGEITRQSALALVHEENKPRYLNIKWYLDALGMDFNETISTINSIPRLSQNNGSALQ